MARTELTVKMVIMKWRKRDDDNDENDENDENDHDNSQADD